MERFPNRKRVRHFEDARSCRELTFSCYSRRPLLTNDSWREMVSQSIDAACGRHGWALTGFVYMPEHVHLLLYPLNPQSSTISSLLRAIKRPVSYRIKAQLSASNSPLLSQLTIQQRPGVMTFRFWQDGGGYDRNLTEVRSVLAAIDYLHLNPVRRELCQRSTDWRWSSARWYAGSPTSDPGLPELTPLPAAFLAGGSNQ